jgi:hypothetical protein
MIAAGEVVGLDAKLEIWSHDWPQKERLAKPKIAYCVRVWTLSATFATDLDYYLTASAHETQFRGLTLQ